MADKIGQNKIGLSTELKSDDNVNQLQNKIESAESVAIDDLSNEKNTRTLVSDINIPIDSQQFLVVKAEIDTPAENFSNYLATSEVDRNALPQTNINESMLHSDYYSGLPIKLRVYINAAGNLVKIEPIAVLDQDIEYFKQLEKLLLEVTFLPAKKNGLDVDSYLEIMFSFNPLPTIDNSSSLN